MQRRPSSSGLTPTLPVTDEQIERAIRDVTPEKEPNPEELNQVASRLASVGWPLAVASR